MIFLVVWMLRQSADHGIYPPSTTTSWCLLILVLLLTHRWMALGAGRSVSGARWWWVVSGGGWNRVQVLR